MADGTVGLVLAAGAGSRFGIPKAMARTPEGEPWLALATTALSDGGCDDIVIVLGALAETALHLVPSNADVVIARQWQRGLSASLLAGLDAVSATDSRAVLVTLADLPELTAGAVRRVADGAGPADLRRAAYAGAPGHPVLLGRDHWAAVSASLDEDAGAATYLAAHGARSVDCTDLGGGDDMDEAVRGVA